MGYVTTAQASEIGIQPMTLVMMRKRGTLKRASRGVYRLVDFPIQPLARFMEATLWPYEQRGVLSHETALALHRLFDLPSPALHITVPARFRIQRNVPTHLIVHRADLPDSDVCQVQAVRITTPCRTITDCIASNLDPAIVRGAIESARGSRLLDAEAAADLERRLVRDAEPSKPIHVRPHAPSPLPAAQAMAHQGHGPMTAHDDAVNLGLPLDLGNGGTVDSQETGPNGATQAARDVHAIEAG